MRVADHPPVIPKKQYLLRMKSKNCNYNIKQDTLRMLLGVFVNSIIGAIQWEMFIQHLD